jgi:midasin (ATPase involved in ribosome maturation)
MSDLINSKIALPLVRSSYDNLFVDEDFKKRTIFLGGIPLSKCNLNKKLNDNQSITEMKITQTPTIEKCLREIALSITLAWTTLISSPISNGKTMIVEYIAEQVGKRLIKIQCSDHMDSKVGENLSEIRRILFCFIQVLLGTYQCTDKPGEFLWTPGLLVEVKIDY